jgi:hypothetical protein
MSGGVQPCLVDLLHSQGVEAAGWCCVVVLHCGPAIALGLCDMGMGVGSCWHLHGVGLAGAVGTGVAWLCLGALR